ncbi:hypothetical protein SAMN05428966_11840 [Massilia sp. PDC64]|nr:hypothetical protein [Massilia sp. PDC64]SDF62760.1 hypothetical protein SAMN05428966_11840 [Massilia sp. PDC64]
MRDGWWIQGHLALMSDLACEADVADGLASALSTGPGAAATALRRSLAAQAARAREHLAWLDLLTPGQPTVAWVTGAPSARTDRFVAHLVNGSAIWADDVEPGMRAVRGYRSAGATLRTMARVTLAEYVEQYQRTGPDPVRFGDGPLWPVDQVLLVELPRSGAARADWESRCSFGPPAVVFFLADAATPDDAWMRTLRARLPPAVMHVVPTQPDARSRDAVAAILRQLAVRRDAAEQRRLAQRIGRHMLRRRRIYDRLTELAGPDLPGRLVEAFLGLDMHLLPASR